MLWANYRASGPARTAVCPLRSTSTSVMDWSQRGPDWKQRGRSQEEMYVARVERELLRKRREDQVKAERADDVASTCSSATDSSDQPKTIVASSASTNETPRDDRPPSGLKATDSSGGGGAGVSSADPPPTSSLDDTAGARASSLAVETLHAVLCAAIDGHHLSSSAELAAKYQSDPSLQTVDERVSSLVNWESGKGFASGFTTGFGGVFVLPIAIPAAVWTSWTMQARLSGAVAELHGFDTRDEFTRTCVTMTLLDTWSPCPMAPPLDSQQGLYENDETHKYVTRKFLREFYLNARVPSMAALAAAQHHICGQLMSRAATRGAAGGLGRAVPVISGVIGGTADAAALQFAGQNAHTLFGKISMANGIDGYCRNQPPSAEPCLGSVASGVPE